MYELSRGLLATRSYMLVSQTQDHCLTDTEIKCGGDFCLKLKFMNKNTVLKLIQNIFCLSKKVSTSKIFYLKQVRAD